MFEHRELWEFSTCNPLTPLLKDRYCGLFSACNIQSSPLSRWLHPRQSWRRRQGTDQEYLRPRQPSWTRDKEVLLFPQRCTWFWNKQNAEQWISLPCLSKERKDKMIARRVEGGRDASSLEFVLQVIARLSTASNPLDHFKFFVFHLIVELLKFPEEGFWGLK